MDKNRHIIKWLVAIGMIGYVYGVMRKNGGTLLGNAEGMKVHFDTDRAVNAFLGRYVDKKWLPLLRQNAKIILDKHFGSYGIEQRKVH